jgi:uncharacterized membrane protein
MAKQQPQRRPAPQPQTQQRKAAPAPARRTEKSESIFSTGREEFIFGRRNFIVIGIGLALVLLGLVAMSGGAMPDPDTWDPNIIYSFRRITLAPIMMVAGFVVVAYGIFIKDNAAKEEPDNSPAA